MDINDEESISVKEEIDEDYCKEGQKLKEFSVYNNICTTNKNEINNNRDCINQLRKVTSEFKCENVVNSMLDFFKKNNGTNFKSKEGNKFSTSSALPNGDYLHNLTSRLFLDLKENRESILLQILKKISILNLIYVRCLETEDLEDAYDLHREWFPVNYLPDFYFSICNFKEDALLNEKQIKLQQRIQETFKKGQNERYDNASAFNEENEYQSNENETQIETEMEKKNQPHEKEVYEVMKEEEVVEVEEEEEEEEEVGEEEIGEEEKRVHCEHQKTCDETPRVHRKWDDEQIFSIGLFLPFSFVDYINSNAIKELLNKKSMEQLSEKDIMLDYIEFIENQKKQSEHENNKVEMNNMEVEDCTQEKQTNPEGNINENHDQEKKDYLIGSISLLINYDEHTKEKDFSNIYDFFKKNFHNDNNSNMIGSKYLKYVLGSSKQFFENYWHHNAEDKKNKQTETNPNDINNNNNNNSEKKKKNQERKTSPGTTTTNNKNSFLDLVILKKCKMNRMKQFQKKIFEEIYMNKNLKKVTKKYLKKKITSVYVLTLGTHEYFRGLHLASFLIEFTILYFYFIVYRIFFYNDNIYCYVDNELFFNTIHNLKIDMEEHVFDDSVISDTESETEDSEHLINSFCNCENQNECTAGKTLANNETNTTKTNVNQLIICKKCCKPQSKIHLLLQKNHVLMKNPQNLLKKDPRKKSKRRNYSICNNIIKQCYKKITATSHLYHLYDVIHNDQWRQKGIHLQKNPCRYTLSNSTFFKNPICKVQLSSKILNLFFHNFEIHNINNKNFLDLQLKNYRSITREDGEINVPLYMYLHVIDYNKAATNLYNKLNFYYICTYDNFYDINTMRFSSYLYSYFF